MSIGFSQRGFVGLVLMIVGIVALLPAMNPTTPGLLNATLAPAAAILALGTYLVGSDVDGQVV